MCLLEVAMCEKRRSSHFLSERGSKQFEDWGLGWKFQDWQVTDFFIFFLGGGEGYFFFLGESTPCYMPCVSFITVLYIHPKSIATTLEIFPFPEAVQVFLYAIPITYSSINSHQNKNQPPLALSSTSTSHTVKYTTPIQDGQRRRFSLLDLHKKIQKSAQHPHSLINTRNKKRQNLGFTHHLHLLW